MQLIDVSFRTPHEVFYGKFRKRVKRLEMERERVMFELVDAEKARFPIQVLCKVLEVSRSGVHAWKKGPLRSRT